MTKYALITGASSGIGYEIAKCLAQKDYKVFGVAPEKDIWEMQPIVNELGVVPLVCDITEIKDVLKIAEFVKENTEGGGRLDILYNNAGITFGGPAVEFDDEKLMKLFQVNVLGHIYMTKYMINYLIAAKGSIIFTSSVAARVPLLWVAAYCSTKAAIDQYALVLHGEMKQYGVRVHSVITGGVNTAICDTITGVNSLHGSLFEVPAAYNSIRAAGNMSRNERTSISPSSYAQQVVKKVTAKRDVGFNIYKGAFAYTLHWMSRFLPLFLVEWGMSFHFKQLKVWSQLRKKLKQQDLKKTD